MRKGLAKLKPQDLFASKIYEASKENLYALLIDLEDTFGRIPLSALKKSLKTKLELNQESVDLLIQCGFVA